MTTTKEWEEPGFRVIHKSEADEHEGHETHIGPIVNVEVNASTRTGYCVTCGSEYVHDVITVEYLPMVSDPE